MEKLRVTEGKASPKREFWSTRSRNHRTLMRSNLLESIAQGNGGSVVSQTSEDGAVTMKLLVRKQDLKQMLELMRSGGKIGSNQQPSYSPSYHSSSSFSSVEQRLNLLRRKHLIKANASKQSCGSAWTPVLQSIPEEL